MRKEWLAHAIWSQLQGKMKTVTCQSPVSGPRYRFSCALTVTFEARPRFGHRAGWGSAEMGSRRRLTPNRGVSRRGRVSGGEARGRTQAAACRHWLRRDTPSTRVGDKRMSVQREEGANGGGTDGAEKQRKENTETERKRPRMLGSDWSAWIPMAKQAYAS